MPHIAINGIEKADFDKIAPALQHKVSQLVDVNLDAVVLEFCHNPLNCCEKTETQLATAHIWWRRRSGEMQKQVAFAIGEIIKAQTNKKTVKVKYVNLDPDDLYTV